MKSLTKTVMISSLLALLSACANTGHSPGQMASNLLNRESITSTTHETYPPKNPQTVALYSFKKSPPTAYRIIGVAHVSKYNLLGRLRPTHAVHSRIKNLAASIGGDGIMDINSQGEAVEAKVIAFQKIML